jgi:hypothetical protein
MALTGLTLLLYKSLLCWGIVIRLQKSSADITALENQCSLD